MRAIVAVDRNWAIGNKGQLLVSIPADHKFFRKETTGKILVYGRKTLETFPMAQVLPGRRNIVLSHKTDFTVKGGEVVHSVDELLELLGDVPSEQVYVIGGESVYRQLLPYCDAVDVTKIDYAYQADAHFPDLDADPEWEITADSDEQVYQDLIYHFLRYERKKS